MTERAGLLGRARDAAACKRWREAHQLFSEADAAGALEPPDLPLAAQVAYAAGQLDRTIEIWERAHADSLRSGDALGAAGAAVRVAMHLLLDTALMAPVRGWLTRAEQLLQGAEDTPVHAWLAVARNYERMLSGDPRRARQWARQAIDVGSRHDPAAAAIGRVAEARSLILDGEVSDGLALLDEAGAAAMSSELDPLSTGVVYCELVCALQGVAQFDLAEEWTQAMERWCGAHAVGSLHGRCRVHRAEILRLRGSLDDAEREVLLACEQLRPYLRRELGWPLAELGRIRLQKGNIAGAEQALLAAHDIGWDPQPGLALVRLAQGDVALAAESIRLALERPSYVPSKELPPDTDLRRAPLFEAQVKIAIAAADFERARSAACELSRVAERFQSKALAASAAAAHGRSQLAEGSFVDAERRLQQAARLWHEVGAPYEIAQARLALAEAQRGRGNSQGAQLELRAAQVSLERMGVGTAAGRVVEPKHNVFRRDGDTWDLAYAGRTVRVRDLKGMRYVARLLAQPEREFHVLELVASENSDAAATALGDAGPMLDARAKQAYRRRLAEIEQDLEEATAMGDSGRMAQANAERDFLLRELSRAVGLGGRDRTAGSASERARASVTRAVRQALARLRSHHAPLAAHLDRAIRTGTYCSYQPDLQAAAGWEL